MLRALKRNLDDLWLYTKSKWNTGESDAARNDDATAWPFTQSTEVLTSELAW